MNVSEITSRDNPLVKHIKTLNRSPAYRRETGEFAAEGGKLLAEAVSSGISVTAVLATRQGFCRFEKEIGLVSGRGARADVTSEYVVKAVSDLASPTDIVFTAKRPVWTLTELSGGRFIVMDRLQNPGNVGTILRCADAFGIDGILSVGECADVFSPKTVRAAMGAAFRVPSAPAELSDLEGFVDRNRLTLYGTSLSETAGDIGDVVFGRSAVVIGNEGSGISDELLARCGALFKIPMKGKAQSLNAAAAAAVIIWEMTK